jgi:hypothetical protein
MKRGILVGSIVAVLLLTGCSRETENPIRHDPPPQSAGDGAPAEGRCKDELARLAAVAEPAVATRFVGLYLEHAKRCPTPNEIEEISYIWKENGVYWREFPVRAEMFFQANMNEAGEGILRKWVGAPFDVARRAVTEDSEFPLVQDRGPTVVGDMILYEFSGAQSVYLFVVRDEKVSRIYLFDQT